MPGQPTQSKLAAFEHIPVVDISSAHDPAKRADLARRVVTVAEEVGFMYIVGHGIGVDAARNLLIHAFAGEVLDGIGSETVRDAAVRARDIAVNDSEFVHVQCPV